MVQEEVGGFTCRVKGMVMSGVGSRKALVGTDGAFLPISSVDGPIFSKVRLAFPTGLIESLLISGCSYSHGLGWRKIPSGAV